MALPKSALGRIASLESLRSAWWWIKSGTKKHQRDAAGLDGQSITSFSNHEDQALKRLQADILGQSGYSFQPLRAVIIPKDKPGQNRIICVPTIKDRIVQRAILQYLSEGDRCGINSSVSYGFLPKKSVREAATVACRLRNKYEWAFKTDIQTFFDSIPREQLIVAIKKNVQAKTLHPLLINAVSCEIFEPQETKRNKIKKAGIKGGVGVRQGMPLSPFFANLILKRFDKEIQRRQIKMVRYADDLVFLAKTESECHTIKSICVDLLKPLGLEVPDIGPNSKSIVVPPGQSVDFLGVELVKLGEKYEIRISETQINKIKTHLFNYSNPDFLQKEKITISNFGQKFISIIAGYSQAYWYCDNYAQLEGRLLQWKTGILEKLFGEHFGIPVSQLSEAKRGFLELNA